jgi:hypothetical protein
MMCAQFYYVAPDLPAPEPVLPAISVSVNPNALLWPHFKPHIVRQSAVNSLWSQIESTSVINHPSMLLWSRFHGHAFGHHIAVSKSLTVADHLSLVDIDVRGSLVRVCIGIPGGFAALVSYGMCPCRRVRTAAFSIACLSLRLGTEIFCGPISCAV